MKSGFSSGQEIGKWPDSSSKRGSGRVGAHGAANGALHKPIDVHLHIGREMRRSGSGGTYHHVNAHSGEVQADVPLGGATDIEAAVAAATAAFDGWRRRKPSERRDLLSKLGDIVAARAQEFGEMVTLENGTPISITVQQAAGARAWISYYAGWADKLEGSVSSTFMHGRDFSYSLPEPFGVIGAIIPWNGPLHSLAMKSGPALAAGNTLVLKPSELAPFSAELFAQCVREAGIPDGVCNIVPGGVEAGEALVRHPAVEKISFTGGPATARHILASCAENLKPALLELGGKSANIVFQDADLDFAAIHATTWGLAMLSGQGCSFPTRLLVQEGIYDELVARCVERARSLPMGDPFDPSMAMGPVITAAAADRIVATAERAVREGNGRLLVGGRRASGPLARGAYVEPTVFADVDPACNLAQQEVFGPVLSILKFRTEAEAISIANSTRYGLAAFVHCHDLDRAHRVAEELRAGGVFINGAMLVEPDTPFGGLGLSGFGREGGRVGIDEYLRPKTVSIGRKMSAGE
jgi:aldehyde dehydrogenase (NAD+)